MEANVVFIFLMDIIFPFLECNCTFTLSIVHAIVGGYLFYLILPDKYIYTDKIMKRTVLLSLTLITLITIARSSPRKENQGKKGGDGYERSNDITIVSF